jgi:hypothetical protein
MPVLLTMGDLAAYLALRPKRTCHICRALRSLHLWFLAHPQNPQLN